MCGVAQRSAVVPNFDYPVYEALCPCCPSGGAKCSVCSFLLSSGVSCCHSTQDAPILRQQSQPFDLTTAHTHTHARRGTPEAGAQFLLLKCFTRLKCVYFEGKDTLPSVHLYRRSSSHHQPSEEYERNIRSFFSLQCKTEQSKQACVLASVRYHSSRQYCCLNSFRRLLGVGCSLVESRSLAARLASGKKSQTHQKDTKNTHTRKKLRMFKFSTT